MRRWTSTQIEKPGGCQSVPENSARSAGIALVRALGHLVRFERLAQCRQYLLRAGLRCRRILHLPLHQIGEVAVALLLLTHGRMA